MGFLDFFRRKSIAILDPTFGQLILSGDDAYEALAEADHARLGPMFGQYHSSTSTPPRADVLFAYMTCSTDGRIAGTNGSLRDIIEQSGARVVVVATENSVESYIAAAPVERSPERRANLVMTLERMGDAFGTFYERLFRAMYDGRSMPMVWAELAPQVPDASHDNCPEAIFSCELGQLTFARS